MKQSSFKIAAIILISFFAVLAYTGVLRAAIINDGSGNISFDTARNIDQYFSTGVNADVGNDTQDSNNIKYTPNPLSNPWVSIVNSGTGGQRDFFSFTVGGAQKSWVWLDVDYGWKTFYTAPISITDYNTQIRVYDSSQAEITNSVNIFNDGDYRYGGTGSAVNSDITTLDAFWSGKLDPGTYYIHILGAGGGEIPPAGTYTLQVSVENPVPIPPSVLLFGTGLLGLLLVRRRARS
jgi:hypothetical protein